MTTHNAAETRPILNGRADWIGSRGQMRGILVTYGQDPQPGDTVRWYSTSRGRWVRSRLDTCWGEFSRSGGTLWTVTR